MRSVSAEPYFLQLGHFVYTSPGVGTGVNDVVTRLPSSTARWSPGFDLLPDTDYYFFLEGRAAVPGLAFTTPTDAVGVPLVGFEGSGSGLSLESSFGFHTIPEPGAMSLAAAAAGRVLVRRRRPR